MTFELVIHTLECETGMVLQEQGFVVIFQFNLAISYSTVE